MRYGARRVRPGRSPPLRSGPTTIAQGRRVRSIEGGQQHLLSGVRPTARLVAHQHRRPAAPAHSPSRLRDPTGARTSGHVMRSVCSAASSRPACGAQHPLVRSRARRWCVGQDRLQHGRAEFVAFRAIYRCAQRFTGAKQSRHRASATCFARALRPAWPRRGFFAVASSVAAHSSPSLPLNTIAAHRRPAADVGR